MTRTGRPPVFDEALRGRYLDAVAAGMPLGAAAAHVGITTNIPRRHERTDRKFTEALAEAKAVGRELRVEDVPHGESRYNNYGCRCPICTRAATAARTGRRHRDTGGDVIGMPPPTALTSGVAPLALLRKAS